MQWYLEKLEKIAIESNDDNTLKEAMHWYNICLNANAEGKISPELLKLITSFINLHLPPSIKNSSSYDQAREKEVKSGINDVLSIIDYYTDNDLLSNDMKTKFAQVKKILLDPQIGNDSKCYYIYAFDYYKEQADVIISGDYNKPSSK